MTIDGYTVEAAPTVSACIVHPDKAFVIPVDDPDNPICAMLWPTDARSEAETMANAAMIAQAFRVYAETGKTPGELAYELEHLCTTDQSLEDRLADHVEACWAEYRDNRSLTPATAAVLLSVSKRLLAERAKLIETCEDALATNEKDLQHILDNGRLRSVLQAAIAKVKGGAS